MAIGDVFTTMLLSDKVVQIVFKEILKNRSAIFKELLSSLGRSTRSSEEDNRKQVEVAISRLKEADLIKERRTDIEDFNSYSVTSEGLNAERQLRLIENNSTPH